MPGTLKRLASLDTTRTSLAPRPRLKPRGLPPALAAHAIYSAFNPADAAAYGQDMLGAHRVVIDTADVEDFQATFHGVLLRDITLGYLDYSTAVTVDVLELGNDHLVIVPANGESTVTNQERAVQASPVMAVLPAPGTAMTLSCERDAAHLLVRISHAALDLHLSRLLGRSIDRPLEFDLGFDLSTGTASRWNFAVQMLHAEILDMQSLLHTGVGVGQLEEFVMSSLLYTQPSNYTEQLHNTSGVLSHRAVRIATEYIERNLAEPITVQDIANEAEVSVRTLQGQFKKDLGQTPTSYLRNRRLDRARADLADTSPNGSDTVTQTAYRWGFTHMGRFSVTYRNRFGETPSQTLRT